MVIPHNVELSCNGRRTKIIGWRHALRRTNEVSPFIVSFNSLLDVTAGTQSGAALYYGIFFWYPAPQLPQELGADATGFTAKYHSRQIDVTRCLMACNVAVRSRSAASSALIPVCMRKTVMSNASDNLGELASGRGTQ